MFLLLYSNSAAKRQLLCSLQGEFLSVKILQRRHALRLTHDRIILEFFAFTVLQLFVNGAEL